MSATTKSPKPPKPQGMQKAPGLIPGAFTVFRVTRWLKGTFRKTPDQFLVYSHTITKRRRKNKKNRHGTVTRKSHLNSSRQSGAEKSLKFVTSERCGKVT